ncbi:fructosamine kinase family protein [Psychroflexus aestuariivivens]|uniref:fructosamine kinase family protein n=1 Tax=Psychroflexus aestuariivivens TaxID=1795040 RepID=UPI000FDA8DD4|nr:fructosamine kinase family protein [Psychroflexus aestuariivivens]
MQRTNFTTTHSLIKHSLRLIHKVLAHIEEKNNFKATNNFALSGGDINQVFKIETNIRNYVIKINFADRFPEMFQKEASGLEILRNSKTFKIPEVIDLGEFDGLSYLLLEFIESGQKNSSFYKDFGETLAEMHQVSSEEFGLQDNNYIGELPQYNVSKSSASEFYLSQRLEPQFKMAKQRGFSFSNLNSFYKKVEQSVPDEAPSLVHGDLWSGNYMVDKLQNPVLIDPAVAFAPRELDFGMMSLFGGFPDSVYESYQNKFPLQSGWRSRLPMFQLYYLLVHLNIFGSSYLGSVEQAMQRSLQL